MRILMVNIPHTAIGSRIPREHLPPLGLLAVGGPLVDAGHYVQLYDAELSAPCLDEMISHIAAHQPRVLLFGHSGSTSAHPTITALTRRVRAVWPELTIVYGGAFPTFHFQRILESEPQIDFIVRGEGERTTLDLIVHLERGTDVARVRGIAFRRNGAVVVTPDAPLIEDLDSCRVAWELIDPSRYSYYGGKRAVVMQFSRGCPHRCTFCGQHAFWAKWRHRDPSVFAREIAWLHRTHGIELVNLADENPTGDPHVWRELLQALISENSGVAIVASMRADHVVRDADILHLYRKAGIERFLLGIENTDETTLRKMCKASAAVKGHEAVRLLRRQGIISLASWVADIDRVTDRYFLRSLRQLLFCDPDQITALYATPHRWTEYYHDQRERGVIQLDQRLWDYKHQVLDSGGMSPWRVILWVKFIEAVLQTRPKALWRTFCHRDRAFGHGMRWYARIGRRVWFYEWWCFLLRDRRVSCGPTLGQFWGEPEHMRDSTTASCDHSVLAA